MVKLQKIYKLCEGFESLDRKSSIKRLMSKGYSESTANNYYNTWRRHYIETNSEDLMLSGIYIKSSKESKLLEECTYKERQRYLEALIKEQLIKITQAVLK